MLTIASPEQSTLVPLGVSMRGSVFPYPAWTEDSSRWIVSYFDPLNAFQQGADFWYPIGDREIGAVFGFHGAPASPDVLVVNHKPMTTGYDEFYDSITYGSDFRRGGAIFSNVLWGGSFMPSEKREKQCRHSTFRGRVSTSGTELYQKTMGSVKVYGVDVPCLYYNAHPWSWGKLVLTSPWTFEVSRDVPNWRTFDFLSLLKELGDHGLTVTGLGAPVYAPPGQIISIVLTGLTHQLIGGSLSISYKIALTQRDISSGVVSQWWKWDSSLTYQAITPLPLRNPNLYGWYQPHYTSCKCTFAYTNFTTWRHPSYTYPLYDSPVSYIAPDVTVGAARIMGGLGNYVGDLVAGDGRIVVHKAFTSSQLPTMFYGEVRRSILDILPSAVFSTVNAFSDLTGSLDTNLIETLTEIDEVAGLMPDIKLAVSILGTIWNKDFSGATLRQIIDLGTKTTLQASFTWAPYADLVTVQLPKIGKIISEFDEPKKLSLGYGEFRKVILNDLGRGEVFLTTRTKVVLNTSIRGFLAAFLRLDAMGLAPRPSRLWDTIPFSFVADWALKIGSMLERIETSALLIGVPALFVHTYTLTSPLTPDELKAFSATSLDATPPELRVHWRDVSKFSPVPRYSRFGFEFPANWPPLGLVGSLFYQLFKGR
jgi:hypothetical protein